MAHMQQGALLSLHLAPPPAQVLQDQSTCCERQYIYDFRRHLMGSCATYLQGNVEL